MIPSDVLGLAAKYGLLEYLPPFLISLMDPHSSEAVRLKAVENLKADPEFFYRATYGVNLDGLYYLEYEEFFQTFFDWDLKNRDDEKYDFDWQIADEIYNSFQIPEKYLTAIFVRPWPVWTRLHQRRTTTLIEAAHHRNVTDAESRKQESVRHQAQPRRVIEEERRQSADIRATALRLPPNFQI